MRLGFITSNQGKIEELLKSLKPLGYDVIGISQSYPEIQANTIDEVAQFGLKWILNNQNNDSLLNSKLDLIIRKNKINMIVVEDSGLFVHGLNNFPGVYSKFTFQTIGYVGILKLLKNKSDRSAHFESCIGALLLGNDHDNSLIMNENEILTFKGECYGQIVMKPRGVYGFGYDPIFKADRVEITFAEMSTEEKNKFSHRGKAVKQLIQFIGKIRKEELE